MTREDNSKTLDLLLEVDDEGEDLTSDEIEFVATLIDANAIAFSESEAARIRGIHSRRVEGSEEQEL